MFEIEDSKPTNCVVAKRSSLVGIGIVGEERKEGNECSVRNDVARNGKINIEAEGMYGVIKLCKAKNE